VRRANRVENGLPSILELLGRVRLAPRQVAKGVTLWPLVLDSALASPPDRELWPLDEALEDGFVGVGAEPGGRPRGSGLVRVESRAPVPVWVPAGELLGGAGRAAGSRIVPPHGSIAVRALGAGPPCWRCARAVASAFHATQAPVGFVAAVHDRAVALELVVPAGLFARRFARRLEAWAPWLLAAEESDEAEGFESPEALLAAVAAGQRLAGRARAEVICAGPATALSM